MWGVIEWLMARFRSPRPRPKVELSLAYADDPIREHIYRARYEVYAHEPDEHPHPDCDSKLQDSTDAYNVYVVATCRGVLQGFVAITPPGFHKDLQRHGVEPAHAGSHELRLLTVLPGCRGRGIGSALVFAAARYVAASGGTHLEALVRADAAAACVARGMDTVGHDAEFVHVRARPEDLRASCGSGIVWNLPFEMRGTSACAHGGERLEVDHAGIHADVLDAWFPPAPAVIQAVTAHPNDIRVTPPAHARELLDTLEATRGLKPSHVLLGAGASDLIYRCFFTWLGPQSRVLLLDPTYAEYDHVLRAIGCRVTKMHLDASNGYALTPQLVPPGEFDLVVLCNPNSPTGVWSDLGPVLDKFATRTRVWVDETYLEYSGKESLEALVETRPNLVICKSMSAAYALSGLRVGYVYAHPVLLDAVRARSPPWPVSRVAQRAAIAALRSPEYYADHYGETHVLRGKLEDFLRKLEWTVVPGACANFVMARPPSYVAARDIVESCAKSAVYLRLVDDHTVRIAVKGHSTQKKLMAAIEEAVFLSIV